MDFTALPLGADLSHYQRRPDFGHLVADGVAFVIIKATQGRAVDPDFDWNRNEAARRNIPWLPYPFLQPDDNKTTIKFFLDAVGVAVPVALDWEVAQTRVTVLEAWMNGCEERTRKPGLVYYGLYPPEPITDRVVRWPRWLPEYVRDFDEGPKLPPWDGVSDVADWSTTWLIWQYTGTGRLPGLTTSIDLNRLACPLDVFKRWYNTGILPACSRANLPAIITDRVLYQHCSGADVLMLQRHLLARGFVVALDGDYGPQTKAEVIAFQRQARLPIDGIAGPNTIAALNATDSANATA